MLLSPDDNQPENSATSCTLEKDTGKRATVLRDSDATRDFDWSELSLSKATFSKESPFSVQAGASFDEHMDLEEVVLHVDEAIRVSLESAVLCTEKSLLRTCVSYVKSCLTKENLLIAANLAGQAAAVGSFIGLILAA